MSNIRKDKGKPEAGKIYALTGGPDTPSIASGNTWAESEVKEDNVLGDGTRQTEKNKTVPNLLKENNGKKNSN